MRTFKTVLLIVAITFSSVLSASTTPTTPETSSITGEIQKLLQNPSFEIDQDINALVTITFNQDNEIVVLHVNSKNSELKSFIKSRLNYKKFSTNLSSDSKTYIVPVRLTQNE